MLDSDPWTKSLGGNIPCFLGGVKRPYLGGTGGGVEGGGGEEASGIDCSISGAMRASCLGEESGLENVTVRLVGSREVHIMDLEERLERGLRLGGGCLKLRSRDSGARSLESPDRDSRVDECWESDEERVFCREIMAGFT